MARPKKQTVDYFPHDCDCLNKKTLYIIENKFGNDGYAFWFKLLEFLGSTDGHFIDCNDISTWHYFLARIRVDEDKALDILKNLSNLNAIDRELWNAKIIWSQNFVNRLEDAYIRRKIGIPTKPNPDNLNIAHSEIIESEKKEICRRMTISAIKKGLIKKTPCRICGATENIECHHNNYDDPFDIVFYCKIHHKERHKILHNANTIDKEKDKCIHNVDINPQTKLKETKLNNINNNVVSGSPDTSPDLPDNTTPLPASESKIKYSTEFESWYKNYPRKAGKFKAFNHFKKILKAGKTTIDDLNRSVVNYKKHLEDKGVTEERFILMADTFLSPAGRRWEDYLQIHNKDSPGEDREYIKVVKDPFTGRMINPKKGW